MAVAFLLGSGISDVAGMPGVRELTAQVLGGGNVVRYAGTYPVVDDSSILPDRVEADAFVRTRTARLRLRVVTDGVSGGTVFKLLGRA